MMHLLRLECNQCTANAQSLLRRQRLAVYDRLSPAVRAGCNERTAGRPRASPLSTSLHLARYFTFTAGYDMLYCWLAFSCLPRLRFRTLGWNSCPNPWVELFTLPLVVIIFPPPGLVGTAGIIMRAFTALAAASAAWMPLADAFAPSPHARSQVSFRASGGEECETSACEIPSDFDETPSLVGVPNGANAIRSAVVTNSAGDFVRIDDAIQSSSSKVSASAPQVVVYLRHMG